MTNALIPFSDVQAMARSTAESKLFGTMTEAQALSLMLLCQAKNLHPMLAVERYHIIQGKPAMKAETMLAVFLEAGGHVEWKRRDDKECTAIFSHPSGGSVTVTWTLEMAKQAGLAGKDVWKNYGRAMLHARCVSEGVRAVYPAAVLGVYTPEEIRDIVPEKQEAAIIDVQPVKPPAPAMMKPPAPKVPETGGEGPQNQSQQPPTTPESETKPANTMTDKQRGFLFSLFKSDENAIKAAIISVLKVDKRISELTKSDAKALIDWVKANPAPTPITPPSDADNPFTDTTPPPPDGTINEELDLDVNPFAEE